MEEMESIGNGEDINSTTKRINESMKPFKYPSQLNLIGSMFFVLFFYNNEKERIPPKERKNRIKA
jgi:hypothetical protein